MNKKLYIEICALILVLFTAAISSQAAPGNLDTTFGVNGKAVTPIGTIMRAIARGVAVQADGKIVAAGNSLMNVFPNSHEDFAVVRYNADGSLDTTFGVGGIVTTDVSGSGFNDIAWSVAIQTDGKIVAAGFTDTDPNVSQTAFAVVRYNTNGSLDTSFSGDGIVKTGSYYRAYSLVLQSDGKIVVAGEGRATLQGLNNFTVTRYNSDGSIDPTFGTNGTVTTPIGGLDRIRSVVIQTDGKIVAAGYSNFATLDFVIVRYNTDGSLDAAFGTGGKVTTPIGTSTDAATAVALQRDGKIVVAGQTVIGVTTHSAVLRYNPNGSLDTTFDGDGIVVTTTDASFASNSFEAVAIQANGKIVTAGYAGGVGKVVRYKTNGSLDSTGSFRWGTTGIVTADYTYAAAIAIQPNGKVVAAGDIGSGNPPNHFVVARYQGDPAANFDYDRDGTADISVFRPSEGNWYFLGSSNGSVGGLHWGIATDELASADYDGDLRTDFAVWRAGPVAYLYILNSLDNTLRIEQFGQTGDDPSVVGDYDGDGKADPAVYRNGAAGQQSYFYYRGSLNNPNGNTTYVPWGTGGDVAARGDFTGDGRLDPTVFRPSNAIWYSLNLANNTAITKQWGISTDRLVPADYDADGKTDYAVFRNGIWYMLQSNSGPIYASWGLSTDKLVPADYDGDGRADVAVYRDGIWHIQQSTGGFSTVAFGLSTDIPAPTAYLP